MKNGSNMNVNGTQVRVISHLGKEMSQFTGWFLVGNAVWVMNTHGLNMLINVFFGVVFNAARGVAMTVTGALSSFVNILSFMRHLRKT